MNLTLFCAKTSWLTDTKIGISRMIGIQTKLSFLLLATISIIKSKNAPKP